LGEVTYALVDACLNVASTDPLDGFVVNLVENYHAPRSKRVALSSPENSNLLRVRRIRGQLEAVERALEDEIGCSDMLQLIAGLRGALNGLLTELLEDYIRTHVVDPSSTEQTYAAVELVDVIRSNLK
jgi:FrmR/RcnR family transcriptional regulator, repressor of rcnA expression